MPRSDVEIRRYKNAEKALAYFLARGPMNSRMVKMYMQAEGFGTKTTRAAREQLKVQVERRGFGGASTTYWSLQDHVLESLPELESPLLTKILDRVLPGRPAELFTPKTSPFHERRVEFFATRGLSTSDSAELASALDARDRSDAGSVSCAECACWIHPEWCAVRRPPLELHVCDAIRRDAP